MNPEIYSILDDIKRFDKKDPIGDQSIRIHLSIQTARLRVLLAEESKKFATKTEKATRWIIRLTWAIAILTAFLVLTSFFVFPKIHVIFDKDTSFKIETDTETKNRKHIQTLPERSETIPNIRK